MSAIDWAIVAVYGAVLIAIGVAASRKQNTTDEYFRGSRQLPWWAIGLSLIATSFSAASLLGSPGLGYNNGLLYLQTQIGDLIGFSLVIAIFLPFFVGLNLTTAYEYLEKRFDSKTRSLGSLCFLLFVIARLGGLLYAASLALSTVVGIPLYAAILLVGIVSIVYTVAGGIAAVIWTDVLQFGMIFVGLAAGLWAAAAGVPGGLGQLWSIAGEAGKLQVINTTWEPASIYSLPTAVFAYGVLAFAVAGTNQQSVQRYVSCASEADGRKAILLGWFSGFIGVAATLLLGVLLFSFYSVNPGLPADIPGDAILPHFILNNVPSGASGLLVAAIFAAAMSSIDSALHSLATCLTVDFYERYSKAPLSESRSLKVAQGLIVFWGVIGIVAAFLVANQEANLLEFLIEFTTFFVAPLLGLFLMGVLFPRINAEGAFYGTVIAVILLTAGTDAEWFTFPGIWRSAIVAPSSVIIGYIISLWGPVPAARSIEGLTLWSKAK
ncbi:MAG: sodium:solute symporter [Cyanobacteria bacterium P01_C01_bin.69]